jgi:hypothetical protein
LSSGWSIHTSLVIAAGSTAPSLQAVPYMSPGCKMCATWHIARQWWQAGGLAGRQVGSWSSFCGATRAAKGTFANDSTVTSHRGMAPAARAREVDSPA